MTVVWLALGALAGAVAVATVVLIAQHAGVRGRVRRRCLVSCKDGRSFVGVLWAAPRECLVLRQASEIGDDERVAIDGEVVVLRPDVSFVQFP